VNRFRLLGVFAALVILAGSSAFFVLAKNTNGAVPPARVRDCSDLTLSVYQRVNPRTGATLFTTDAQAAKRAVRKGYTFDRGIPFTAAATPGPGLSAVHRLENRTGDQLWLPAGDQLSRAVVNGYVDRGPEFYVYVWAAQGQSPIYLMVKDDRHQYAGTLNVRTDLEAEGWRPAGEAFSAPIGRTQVAGIPATSLAGPPVRVPDGKFTLAVLPDTQQEVLSDSDERMANRINWLTRNRDRLRLRFVAHVGDVVNWDSADHAQYERARTALQGLTRASIPYALAPGNHDALATCEGGVACPDVDLRQAVRRTETFNRYFSPPSMVALDRQYVGGRSDNASYVFRAEGKKFLVLVLELWPRPEVVKWAQGIIATRQDTNVIVVTHSFLTATGRISQLSEYGNTSPAELYARLVQPYGNVKLVLSGHVGTGVQRELSTKGGGKAMAYLQCFHDGRTNPVRLLQIDVHRGSITSLVYSPFSQQTYPSLRNTVTGIEWR
jgi:hypothetical protein